MVNGPLLVSALLKGNILKHSCNDSLCLFQGSPLFQVNNIHDMWKRGVSSNLAHVPQLGSVTVKVDKKLEPKTPADKYVSAMVVAKNICDLLSQCGSQDYAEKLSFMKSLFKIWAEGGEAVLLQKVKSNQVCPLDGEGIIAFLIFAGHY